jgi:hypothetical protein
MFIHGYDSLWLSKNLLATGEQPRLVDALVEGAQAAPVMFHFNKGLAGAPADALALTRDTATNARLLDAFTLVIVANGGMPLYPGVPWKAPDP